MSRVPGTPGYSHAGYYYHPTNGLSNTSAPPPASSNGMGMTIVTDQKRHSLVTATPAHHHHQFNQTPTVRREHSHSAWRVSAPPPPVMTNASTMPTYHQISYPNNGLYYDGGQGQIIPSSGAHSQIQLPPYPHQLMQSPVNPNPSLPSPNKDVRMYHGGYSYGRVPSSMSPVPTGYSFHPYQSYPNPFSQRFAVPPPVHQSFPVPVPKTVAAPKKVIELKSTVSCYVSSSIQVSQNDCIPQFDKDLSTATGKFSIPPSSSVSNEKCCETFGATGEAETQKKSKPKIMVGRRRGGKALPTGVIKIKRPQNTRIMTKTSASGNNDKKECAVEQSAAWQKYMAEMKRYKEQSCIDDSAVVRPLVK